MRSSHNEGGQNSTSTSSFLGGSADNACPIASSSGPPTCACAHTSASAYSHSDFAVTAVAVESQDHQQPVGSPSDLVLHLSDEVV
jgi:hypothetical protein